MPSIGTNAPHTTELYVNATEGGNPIIGTKDAFACNVDAGLRTGALYYLDGKSEHETEVNGVKIPTAYRNITLDSSAGGASFHFHAGDTRGPARITCTIEDPRDHQVKTASVVINVGSASAPAAGMPASVVAWANSGYRGYLGTFQNVANVENSVGLQARVSDEVGQEVTDGGSPNLQVYIQGGTASAGAKLVRDGQSGTVIMTTTRNGIADFRLYSGVEYGVITLLMVADRADNNVANGIQDPVAQRMAVQVVNGIPTATLTVADQTVTATCRQEVSAALVASGGFPPYTWSAVGTMPAGLTLAADGLVTGVPIMANGSGAGSRQVLVRVTDGNGTSVTAPLTVTLEAGECKPLAIKDSSVTVTQGKPFTFALSTTGGTSPFTWKIIGDSSGLTLSPAGILSGQLPDVRPYNLVVEVTDSEGISVTGNLTISVSKPAT